MRSKIDWLVYKWSWPFVSRYLRSSRGVSYLSLLTALHWHFKNPISDELRDATETFFDALYKDEPEVLALIHSAMDKEPTS